MAAVLVEEIPEELTEFMRARSAAMALASSACASSSQQDSMSISSAVTKTWVVPSALANQFNTNRVST